MKQQNQVPCAEWVDKLVLREKDLSPAEHTTLKAHLNTCVSCATASASYQDLSMRLRTLPHPAAKLLSQPFPELFPDEGNSKSRGHKSVSSERKNLRREQPSYSSSSVLLALPTQRSWQQRISTLAAVLIVILLTGTSALLFTRLHSVGSTANSPIFFQLPSTWKHVAFYSGTGKKTISKVNITLPSVWGSTVACVGSGKIDIAIVGSQNNGHMRYEHNETYECTSAKKSSPISFNLEPWTTVIQDITVTSDPSLTWYVQLAVAKSQPAFSPDSQWVSVSQLGEMGSLMAKVEPPLTANGKAFQTKEWDLVLICIGTGQGSIQLSPNINQVSLPPCDGQVRLHSISYASSIQVQQIQVNVTGSILWGVALFACSTKDHTKCSVKSQ